jgi:hypothetical protein
VNLQVVSSLMLLESAAVDSFTRHRRRATLSCQNSSTQRFYHEV